MFWAYLRRVLAGAGAPGRLLADGRCGLSRLVLSDNGIGDSGATRLLSGCCGTADGCPLRSLDLSEVRGFWLSKCGEL